MKLTGTKTQEVDVDISAEEMVRGLYYECGLGSVYESYSSSGTCWQTSEEGKNGEVFALCEYKDVSQYGSPYYKPTGRAIKDLNKIRAYQLLRELDKIVEKLKGD